MKEKIVLGLSGGVDSAVAARLLQERYEVTGLYLDIGLGGTGAADAAAVAERLGIPFETADIRAVRGFTQRLPQPSARIYVGPGKLQEIADFCREEEIDVVIFDDELTPSQTRNIEKEMPCRLLDRTRLILDISMSRAQTA